MKHAKPSLPLRLISLGSLLLLSAVLSVTSLVLPVPDQESIPAQAPVQAAMPDPVSDETLPYLIKDTGGMVCVYHGGTLIYKTTIPVASLPEQDRKKLSWGIEVADETEMHQLLEDFGA